VRCRGRLSVPVGICLKNTVRVRDAFEPSRAVPPPEKRRRLRWSPEPVAPCVSSFAQSRLLMLRASGMWTRTRDALIHLAGAKEARAYTRLRGQGTNLKGLTPWHLIFEMVAGSELWQSNLSWCEHGWLYFSVVFVVSWTCLISCSGVYLKTPTHGIQRIRRRR